MKQKIEIPLSEIEKLLRKRMGGGDVDREDEMMPEGMISVMDNHVFFYADVTPPSALKLTNILTKIRNDQLADAACRGRDPEEIHLHINSPGGLATAGFMMYDNLMAIREKVPVWTHIEGQASSAATLLSVAGSRRLISPSSFMLIHELRSFLMGTLHEIAEEYQNLLKFESRYIGIYLKHSNFEEKDLREFLKRDSVFSAEEALSRGLVDEIGTCLY